MSKPLVTRTAFDPHLRHSAPGMRGAIDALVQGSLVELFGAYGVAAAPLPRGVGQGASLPDMSVAVAFHRAGARERSGRLTLSLSSAVVDAMKGSESQSVQKDWARELASQLMGRIKNRLLSFSARVEVGGLSLVDSKLLERHVQATPSVLVYRARTRRGDVVATLSGLPEERELVFVGVPSTTEGSLILF
jgi:hypothetical protein